MKVTSQSPDSLHRDLKQQAASQGVPLRPPATKNFRLKTITTKGQGLACKEDWTTIRSFIYKRHGG